MKWVEARRSELLPVPYFHVVFTVPEELNTIARRAPRLFYDLLFRAAGATLTEIAQSRLHAHIGALCVLHTWSQTLILHPHIHCVVPGGGFSLDDRRRWLGVRKPTFFLAVRVLSRRFRTHLCSMLAEANLPESIERSMLRALLTRVRAREWVVYAKPPFGGPRQVLGYLANYTHRIAISNSRIAGFDGEHVTFRYRDSAAGNSRRLMKLTADEFLRRFLLHVVPPRFVRIRYYGFMANRTRAASLARARQVMGEPLIPAESARVAEPDHCPRCEQGILRIVGRVEPDLIPPLHEDSS